MSITEITSLLQISGLAQTPSPDQAVIEAACIKLLPQLEHMVPVDQAELLWLLAEAVGTDPARQDEAAELADEAWQLALEDNEIALTVKARCAYVRFTAHKHTTFEDYLKGLNEIGFLLMEEWDPDALLPDDEVNAASKAQNDAYAYGVSLVGQGVLND